MYIFFSIEENPSIHLLLFWPLSFNLELIVVHQSNCVWFNTTQSKVYKYFLEIINTNNEMPTCRVSVNPDIGLMPKEVKKKK